MIQIEDLFPLFDEYCRAAGVSEKTLSSRLYGETKKIALLRDGQGLTVARYNSTLAWLAENWPADARWPAGFARPVAA